MTQGFILEVSIARVGSELDVDHLLGATVLTLENIEPFVDAEDPVTQVEILGIVYDVTAVDEAARTVTVAVGLDADQPAGESVYTYPASLEKWAMVEVNGQDDPVSALVGGDVYDKITDGVRDPESQEAVVLEIQNGDWTIVNLVGEEPVTDGAFLDPATVPVNSDVAQQLDQLVTDVDTNTGQLGAILGTETEAGRLQNVEETATQARNLANTADGRVSMSDYEPAAEDVSYIATDVNGNVITDPDTGQPVLLQRNEGSIWLTRTRDRVNLSTNPSFETNLTGWVTTALTVVRETHAGAPAGSYVATLTNDATTGSHYFSDNNGGARYPVTEGVTYTWSILAEAVSGVNTGVYARLDFYDAAGVSVGTVSGTPVNLVVNDWVELGGSTRPWVTAVAPAGATQVTCRIFNDNPSAVWRVDAAMLEMTSILGRYFDGSLYDCVWGSDGTGTAHASQSHMIGGKVVKVFELDDGAWVEKQFMGDTVVDIDASEISHGFMDGERILDRSIPIDKISGVACTTGEALVAGDLVNIYSENGAFRCRKASAAGPYPAHGFVLESAALGAIAYVYSSGYNPYMAVMNTPGTRFLSTTPGQTTATPSKTAGTIVQNVGTAVGPSVLNFTPGDPIRIG